jgi:hypothetical protein
LEIISPLHQYKNVVKRGAKNNVVKNVVNAAECPRADSSSTPLSSTA